MSSRPPSLLPGLKPVLELLHTDPSRIDHIFCKKGLRSREALTIQELCRSLGIRYTLSEQQALDRLCRDGEASSQGQITAHQGVIARLTCTQFCSLTQLIEDTKTAPLPLILACDQIQDPGNVGTLCRTLYALGGAGIIIPKHNGAYLGPAAQRAAAGALERLPIVRATNLAHTLDDLEEAGFTIYGAGGGASSVNAFTHPLTLPAVLVLGNEEKGLRPGVAKRCSSLLRIPMQRPFDSLNVAQAGGILTALFAQRCSVQG